MPTKYFAATASDGETVLRSSASRTYAVANMLKRAGETRWRSSWAGTAALGQKAYVLDIRDRREGDRVEMQPAREITAAEYRVLKAAWEATVSK